MKYPQWYFDQAVLEHATGMGIPKPRKLAQPSLFEKGAKPLKRQKQQLSSAGQSAAAWTAAIAPLKQLPVNIFMAWFMGDAIQVVTLSMVAYALFVSPLTQILAVRGTFAPYRTSDNDASILRAQLVYVMANILCVLFGVYKVGSMGLIPVHKSDWVSWEEPVQYLERLAW